MLRSAFSRSLQATRIVAVAPRLSAPRLQSTLKTAPVSRAFSLSSTRLQISHPELDADQPTASEEAIKGESAPRILNSRQSNALAISEGRLVYFGNLSWDLEPDAFVDEVVNQIGISSSDIVTHRIGRDHLGRSKGFGFIEFQTTEVAQKAAQFTDLVIEGRQALVRIAEGSNRASAPRREAEPVAPNERLFVGNISYDSTEGDLHAIFGEFGTLLNAHMLVDPSTQQSKGFGFVQYDNLETAQKVIEATGPGTEGIELHGRRLFVNYAKARTERPRGIFGRDDSGRGSYADRSDQGRGSYGGRSDSGRFGSGDSFDR